jgi:hypothetical protein
MGSFLLSRMDYMSDEEEWADFLGQLYFAVSCRPVGGGDLRRFGLPAGY